MKDLGAFASVAKALVWGLVAPLVLTGWVAGCDCASGDGTAGDSGPGDAAVDGEPWQLGDGSGPDSDLCIGGALCGVPASCCPPGNECVDGECVAACETGIRCGPDRMMCCPAGNVCIASSCAAPGAECADSYDCEAGVQFCEPTLGRCLPQPDPVTCELIPEFDDLSVTVEWSWEDEEIISIPVVADMDGDSRPEVAVNITRAADWFVGEIVILEGESGAVARRISHDPANDSYGSHGRTSIAAGDVSGDGLADIVYAGRAVGGDGVIVAIDGQGTLLWTSHDPGGGDHTFNVESGGVTLASFDEDPQAEVLVGASLIDHDGLVIWDQDADGARFGSNAGYRGGLTAVADLDGDGTPEIITGRNAWKVDLQPGDPPSATVTPYWTAPDASDGYPAVADLDGDGDPEVVLAASRRVVALDGQTGELFCGVDPTGAACTANPAMRTQPLAIPGGSEDNRGGPPTIADFDDDGRPEIGIAGGYAYSVYDLNRAGETVAQPMGAAAPAPGALFVRWSRATQDLSSNATGSSVFDFQGDGAAEVVYADECFLRVYSGTDGRLQLEIENTNATIHEYPLVVDVDADGNSELLVVATTKDGCASSTPPIHSGVEKRGLFVYGDVNDEWVPTRRVWTQHTYHVTNATSDGNVPAMESPNWTVPGLNNYRQNSQGEGIFNAPDLSVDLSVELGACGRGKVTLVARVSNEGALGVPAGATVEFYEGSDATGTALGSVMTDEPLLPGASTVVRLEVDAPTAPASYYARVDGAGSIDECNEDNNTDLVTEVECVLLQ